MSCQGLVVTAKPIRCPEDTCSSSFATQQDLVHHINRTYQYIPQDCSFCQGSPIFSTYAALQKHRRDVHRTIQTTLCPLQEEKKCNPKKEFDTTRKLRVHLQSQHRKAKHEIDQILLPIATPKKRKRDYTYPEDDCDKDRNYHSNQRLLRRTMSTQRTKLFSYENFTITRQSA